MARVPLNDDEEGAAVGFVDWLRVAMAPTGSVDFTVSSTADAAGNPEGRLEPEMDSVLGLGAEVAAGVGGAGAGSGVGVGDGVGAAAGEVVWVGADRPSLPRF